MAFEIVLATAARADLDETYNYIAEDSPPNAKRWYAAIIERIETLSDMPHRHARLGDEGFSDREVRAIRYGSHRVIYRIDEAAETVYVLRIWHGARREIKPDDL